MLRDSCGMLVQKARQGLEILMLEHAESPATKIVGAVLVAPFLG